MHVSKLVSYAIGVVGVTAVSGNSVKHFTLQTCNEYFWFHCGKKILYEPDCHQHAE